MRKLTFVAIYAALVLAGCAPKPQPAPAPPPAASSADTQPILDPPYNIDFTTAQPADFSDYFIPTYDTQTQSYLLGEGTEYENEVTVRVAAQAGACVYVVAGVHGDEEAAWRAGNLLKNAQIKAGSLYILSPANQFGAAAQPASRYVRGLFDLNRSFDGAQQKNMVQQMANSIYEDIQRVRPDILLDLHEAQNAKAYGDFLGSSLIFTDMGEQTGLLLELVLETQQGTLCSRPFDYFSPAPQGSINKTVSLQLQIPTITVETFRGYEMENRLADQLSIVGRILSEYNLL